MRYILTILLLFTTNIMQLFAFEIAGVIKDETNKAPIEFVMTVLLEKDLVQYSNENGEFKFNDIEEGTYTLMFSIAGWKEKKLIFDLDEDRYFEIFLSKTTVVMDTIEITEKKSEEKETETEEDYSKDEIEKVPVFSDPFNVIDRESEVTDTEIFMNNLDSALDQEIPSNQFYDRGSPKLVSVNGGEPDWNNFYFDYIQLPYMVHLTGPSRSIFPLEIIESVKTFKGISPLWYGPGIGGTFVSMPISTKPDESMIKLNASSSYIDLWSQIVFNDSVSLLFSLRHSIVEFTVKHTDMKQENEVYYPPVTEDLIPTIPERNGDFLTRLMVSIPANTFTLDLLGFYDLSNHAGGPTAAYGEDGTISSASIGIEPESIFGFLSYTGVVGCKWDFSPNKFLYNSLNLYSSYFSLNYNDDAWDDIQAVFTPFRYRGITDITLAIGNELNLHINEQLSWNTNLKFKYENITGNYDSWIIENYEKTFDYAKDDNPVFWHEWDTINPWELHYILDENGLPILAVGELKTYGEDFHFKKTFEHIFPSAYTQLAFTLDNFDLTGGLGYSLFIENDIIKGHFSVEIEGSYELNPGWKLGLRAGLSPGKYNEISFIGRRLNEEFFGITPQTSFVDPPKALTVQPFVKYEIPDFLTISLKPYFNWYYDLSGFSLQTNYRNDADFSSGLTFLEPEQGLSFGTTLDSEIKLGDYFFNKSSYTLSWSLYDIDELGWIYANTDVRHVVKSSLYYEPGWDLIFGATLASYIGTALTPYTITSVDPLESEPGLINSARDYVPKWYLRAQIKKDMELFGGKWSVFLNTYNILAFLPQQIYGFKAPVSIGDSTAVYKNREYRNERDLSSIFEIIELGLSVQYKY